MPLKAKLAAAFAVSMVLVGGLLFFLLHRPEAPGAAGEEAAAVAEPAVEVPAPKAPDRPPAKPRAEGRAARSKEEAPQPAAVSRVVVSAGGGWTIMGRIVRESEPAAAPGASGTAGQAPDSASTPVAGATVHLKPHPRRTRPEAAPPPQKVVTGPDGRFEIAGVPARVWLRIEIDEPSSAYRMLSFSLNDPDAESKMDLGDLPIVPGTTLAVRLAGPRDEPVAGGSILVNRDSSNAGRSAHLQSLGFGESRREAEERGNGLYVLERVPLGPISLEAKAPGYAPSLRVTAELPREEPVLIQLQEGMRIAGTVLAAGGRPVAGAELVAGNSSNPDQAKSDDSGKFVFDALGPGAHDLSVSAEGFVSAAKGRVSAGTEDVEFALVPEAVFAGQVLSEEDGKPIVKARVTLQNGPGNSSFSSETDEKGSFTVKKISAGSYLVVADHPEFATSSEEPRELAEGEKVTGQTIRLPRGFAVSGKVVEAKSQAPVPEAQVSFQLNQAGKGPGSVRRGGKSNPDGVFEVKGLREGTYALTATARGYVAAQPQIVSISEGAKGFTITLEQASSIAGRVLDAVGNPVAGATLRLNVAMPQGGFNDWNGFNQRFQNLSMISAQSDGDGRYRLEGLTPFSGYVVQASHRDFAPASVRGVEVGPRESVEEIDLRLSRGGTIRGRILDEAGRGISGAQVFAALEQDSVAEEGDRFYFGYSAGGSAASDTQGGYALLHLPAGAHTVTARARDRASATRGKVAVVEDRVTGEQDLVLGAGETLAGRVVDALGSPIAGAGIQRYDGSPQEVRTDADGKFEMKGLNPGALHFGVSAAGYLQTGQQVSLPSKEITITLQRSAKVSGRVRATGVNAFTNLQVMAMGDNRQGTFGANQSDPAGKFEIEVGSGTYYLTASASGFTPGKSAPFMVKEGDHLEEIVIDLETGATVQGVVVAAATGQPLAGATVSLVALPADTSNGWGWGGLPSKTTDAEGSFVLEGLPEGPVTITATHPQYAQATVSGILAAKGRPTAARIEMTAGGAIRGLVLRGGRPLANARVNVWKSDAAGQYVGKDAAVDAQGRFEIRGLPAGDYLLSVMVSRGRRGMNSGNTRSVTVAEGQTTEIDLSEVSGVRLSGSVLSGGNPVGGGMLVAMQPQKGWNGNGEIEADGTYVIELPGPGEYFILVQWGGREAGTKIKVTVPEGTTSFDYDLELPSGRISGVVVDAETGAAVPNAQIGAFASGAASRSLMGLFQAMQSMAQTDDQGAFVISSLPGGTFAIRAFADGYADARVERVRLEEGASLADLRIALDRGVSYRLRVADPKGQPVAQAMALVRDGNGELVAFTRPAFSNPQGVLEIQGIRPGTYRITVQHHSYASSSIQAKVEAEGEGPAVTLRPGGKLQVEVVNHQTRPIEGAEVEILNERGENVADERMILGPGQMPSSLTNATGSIVLDQLAPGTYRAVAKHGAARSPEEGLSVTEGQTAQVRLTISE